EQATHTPVNLRETCCGPGDAREKLEKSRLARAVPPNETYNAALRNIKGNITKGPKVIALLTPERRGKYARDRIAEGEITFSLPHAVALSKTFYANDRC